VRSGGPGGQKINKTSSAVVLTDPATGLTVRCAVHRSLSQNREEARRLLAEKLEARRLAEHMRLQNAREKKRRQTRRRSAAQAARVLDDKKRHSAKKALRRPPRPDD
jgi:protein subunit release factor B